LRIALITTPLGARSGIGDFTRQLLPYLRERAEVEIFVEDRCFVPGEGSKPASSIQPRDYDQILYQIGNEQAHAFMRPMLSALGGTVLLHDWVLFDQAVAGRPELAKGGLRGLIAAVEEGGIRAAKIWKSARKRRAPLLDEPVEGASPLAFGWHELEEHGIWSSRSAGLHLVRGDVQAIKLSLFIPEGRKLELRDGESVLREISAKCDERVELELPMSGALSIQIKVSGKALTESKHGNADPRELGIFLSEISFQRAGEWTPEPLHSSQLITEDGQGLSAFRFALPFNRGVVRRADGFIVHSEWMRDEIVRDRNAPTPVLIVPHGIERRWDDFDRVAARAELPLAWRDDFIVASLGTLQTHKRVAALLDGAARARERGVKVRVLLIGEERPRELDLSSEIRRLDMIDSVEITGWVEEPRAHALLCAADVCVNLRGPTTGGASGGASQALGLGRGVIVSDLPELAELPSDATLRVPVGEGEAEALCEHFVSLSSDPALLKEMESAARNYVEERAHWSHVAETCVEALKQFPTPRASRRGIIQNAIRQRTAQREEAQ
jgi:hypothetical protein